MEALYLLIPLSVIIIAVAAWIFLRMSGSGQFDDLDAPAWSILHDDDRPVEAVAGERIDERIDEQAGANANCPRGI